MQSSVHGGDSLLPQKPIGMTISIALLPTERVDSGVGSQLTIRWIMGTSSGTYETSEPVFAAFYVILSASILSVSIKHLIPVLMDQFTLKEALQYLEAIPSLSFSCVQSSGSQVCIPLSTNWASSCWNPCITCSLFVDYWSSSSADFLGNIVNSFLLAIDRPFEVGIESKSKGHGVRCFGRHTFDEGSRP